MLFYVFAHICCAISHVILVAAILISHRETADNPKKVVKSTFSPDEAISVSKSDGNEQILNTKKEKKSKQGVISTRVKKKSGH